MTRTFITELRKTARLRAAGVALLALTMAMPGAVATAQQDATTGLGDQAITDAVEDEIIFDQAVSLANIDVSTRNGMVTLDGTVGNILARDRAGSLAQTVRGVRAVNNQLDVSIGEDRTDAAIEQDIQDALLYDPATEAYEVTVDVSSNVVTLSGAVDSWQERELVARTAKGVDGVRRINNQLDVEYDRMRPDTEVRTEIEEALRWDKQVDAGLIDATVDNGVVTLDGTVGSTAEKQEAVAEAWVAGVDDVVAEDLEVGRWARDAEMRGDTVTADLTDAEIADAIEDALMYEPRVDGYEVTPDVDDGEVTLRGTVESLKAKRAAANAARTTMGVTSVTNRLKVRPEEQIAETTVETNVRAALARDPFVDRFEITVDVVNGTAHLYGTVDTYYEKAQADDVAATASGVLEVTNHLVVDALDTPYTYDPYVDEYYVYDYDWYDYEPVYTLEEDWNIRDDIKDELWWSPFVDSDDVNVTVENGTATLTGTVETWSEYWSARENAYEGGATWVINELNVSEM